MLLVVFGVTVASAPYIISLLKKVQKEGQPIRQDGPETHLQTKKMTPTMGGIIILIPLLFATLFICILNTIISSQVNITSIAILFVLVSFAIIGGVDDYKKLKQRSSKGIRAKMKLLFQFIVAIVTVYLLSFNVSTEIIFPFGLVIDLGWLYYPLAVTAIVSYSNAVNVTDGLDGLVSLPIIIASSCLAIISFYVTHDYEVFYLCMVLIGSCLGFLFFNANPAKIFMGDVGSLSIGALLGAMSIITKHEVVFIIISGLFVVEALSVVIQVYYFKFTGGKRIFRMAPIHHHFEQLGWPENTVVVRFWIFSILCAAAGISLV